MMEELVERLQELYDQMHEQYKYVHTYQDRVNELQREINRRMSIVYKLRKQADRISCKIQKQKEKQNVPT